MRKSKIDWPLSASQIKRFKDSPHKWYKAYVEGDFTHYKDDTPAMVAGQYCEALCFNNRLELFEIGIEGDGRTKLVSEARAAQAAMIAEYNKSVDQFDRKRIISHSDHIKVKKASEAVLSDMAASFAINRSEKQRKIQAIVELTDSDGTNPILQEFRGFMDLDFIGKSGLTICDLKYFAKTNDRDIGRVLLDAGVVDQLAIYAQITYTETGNYPALVMAMLVSSVAPHTVRIIPIRADLLRASIVRVRATVIEMEQFIDKMASNSSVEENTPFPIWALKHTL